MAHAQSVAYTLHSAVPYPMHKRLRSRETDSCITVGKRATIKQEGQRSCKQTCKSPFPALDSPKPPSYLEHRCVASVANELLVPHLGWGRKGSAVRSGCHILKDMSRGSQAPGRCSPESARQLVHLVLGCHRSWDMGSSTVR